MNPDASSISNGAGFGNDGGTAVPASFLRTLAHELRNFVAPVQNATHLLRLRSRTDPALMPVIEIMERQLVGMLRMLDTIGEAERACRGDVALARSAVTVAALVDRALEATRALREGRERAVEVSLEAGVPPLDVDPERMGRALAAVLDNALRYSARDAQVAITAARDGDRAVLCVTDHGPGMSPQFAASVPEPFAAPHVPGHGLGLGLPLARAVVRLHGGDLRIATTPAGTQVSLVVPLGGATIAADTSVHVLPVQERGVGRRVLIADDSAAVRTSLADLLQEMGHEVRAAANGAEAVAFAKEWQPEFVLLDVHMPKLNGFDAARQIRAAFPASRMKLVLMSGEDLDDVMRRGAREAGFDHCIDKGLAIGELGDILARGDTP